jgi:hypothetical protein
MVCAAGTYQEGEAERRAAIFIGPEFGTVQRQDLVQAAREAGDADFDVLVACATRRVIGPSPTPWPFFVALLLDPVLIHVLAHCRAVVFSPNTTAPVVGRSQLQEIVP